MSRLIYLGGSLLIMLASFYPLLSLIKALGNVREISTLAIGLIVVWLVVALIFGLLLFYFTWNDIIEEEEEKYIQLHFKGAVYTVPEIYQVKGLHNSSSLYKITHYSALGRVLAVSKKGVKTRRKTAIWTCSSAGQSNRLIIWRSQVQTLAGPQEGRGRTAFLVKAVGWWTYLISNQVYGVFLLLIHQLSWQSNRFLIYGSWVRVPYVSQQMIP